MSVRDYFALLNDEAREGHAAAAALDEAGVADRYTLLARHPEWHRLGTLNALLLRAREALDVDASVAFELTTFVLAHLAGVRVPAAPAFLRPQLEGTAWKEHGNALFMLGRRDDALDAALRAAELFASSLVLQVDRGSALVLAALVLRADRRFADAEAALAESISIFAEHNEARRYVAAIQTQAMIALDQEDVPRARDRYLRAYEEADRLDDVRERTRILNNLGHCALRLHDLETATDHLSRALSEFTRLRMDGEVQRAVWGIASVERERGNLDAALVALCGAYPRLLDRGLIPDATAVLVDIHDVVVELTSDVAYAHSLCAKLAVTLGRYDVPANVREAVAYLQATVAGTTSLAVVRQAIGWVRRFLHEVLASSSAVFTVPALPEVNR